MKATELRIDGNFVNIVYDSPDARLVFGTESGEWYLVGRDDYYYLIGITIEDFVQMGEPKARAQFLTAREEMLDLMLPPD